MDENQGKSEQLFATFLASRKVLIADSFGASRSGLAKIIVTRGAKTNNLLLADNYEGALEQVQTLQPEILIVDYAIGNNRGLNLATETKNYKNKDERIFILVTSNSSQSTVAQAAEEDVDLFILKPYTIKGFTESLMKVVLAKIYPNDYIKTIKEGKKLLESQDPEGALKIFDKAVTLSDKPTLAYYYRAQAELFKKLLGEAETSYNVGLKVNNLHYKCLTGFFDLLMSQKRNVDAYSVVRQIAKFFPANPTRLSQVLSLAINTGNFADIEQYYDTFKDIEVRNDDLVKYVCASLVVCGRHFFRQNQNEKALEFLKKASITAAGRPNMLREIISVLVDQKLGSEATEVLKRFPEESKGDNHYKVANFLVKNLAEPIKGNLIPDLRTMVHENIKEPIIWHYLMLFLVDLEKVDEAENAYESAIKVWPDKIAYFDDAMKAAYENETDGK